MDVLCSISNVGIFHCVASEAVWLPSLTCVECESDEEHRGDTPKRRLSIDPVMSVNKELLRVRSL